MFCLRVNCHFDPCGLSTFATLVQISNFLKSGSLWFHFYCHFGPILKSGQISKKNVFVLFLKSILVIILLLSLIINYYLKIKIYN
ncbi:hypothetical protein Hanom_Chr03g00228081 [Helianthus anomalus]